MTLHNLKQNRFSFKDLGLANGLRITKTIAHRLSVVSQARILSPAQ